MPQESLLPDTYAIRRGEIEEVAYRGKWPVRWKSLDGVVVQRKFATVEESHPFFLECVNKLREQLRANG